jgi:hypothetical protein
MAFIISTASNLTQSTLTGFGEILVGPAAIIAACPSWINDILNNQTTYLDTIGTTPRSLCILGAEATYDGFWKLAYIPCLYVGSVLTGRIFQYCTKNCINKSK